ncbi:serine/threonine-protein kinase [Streptomyces sp. NPDC021012]|uniref:serine/threonine-protein kinase n=1 Tax=Streptomyces sp. NPDC021012 TaxID=3365107 RepID=UPI00379C8232
MTEGARAGEVVGGRYQLVQSIAAGGMGRVWKAYDERLQTEVALKELWLTGPLAPGQRAELLKRAELEALNAVRLRDHPNIVTVHDVVIENGVPWIVMQLISGGTLEQRLRTGPLPVADAEAIASALLDALDAAHRNGIVHRDVKPANVMIGQDGRILLGDFGIAAPETGTGLTSTGAVIGSAPYLAPERAAGLPGRASSDLFSLGVTLYEAVEGVSPFLRDTWAATADAVRFEEAPPMRGAGRLEPLITALLVKDPAARPTVAEASLLLKGQGPSRPRTPTEIVAPPQASGAASSKATLKVTNNGDDPIRLHLGTDHLGLVPGGRTVSFATEPTNARRLRVSTGDLAGASHVLRLRPGHPVHLTVTVEDGKPVVTGDGIVRRPAQVRETPRPAVRPAAPAVQRPKPATTSKPTSDDGVWGGFVFFALLLAALGYFNSAAFSGWVSHYLHGSTTSLESGDCVYDDTREQRPGYVVVPCQAAAAEYEVRDKIGYVGQPCPEPMKVVWIAPDSWCAEKK